MQADSTLQRQSKSQSLPSSDLNRASRSNMEGSQLSSSQLRTASGPTRGHGSKSANPDKQISQIEKSVTHLLVATKQLLETLTQWSRGNSQEEEVSDVYVRLGYEFNLACRAFNSIGVETSDLGPVPDLLRSILEDTLSQPASPQALDNYLPRIRDIIINLLHGLKRKQSKLRSRSGKDAGSKSQPVPPRQSSVGSVGSTADLGSMGVMESSMRQGTSSRAESRQDNITANEEPDWTSNSISRNTPNERGSIQRRSVRNVERPSQVSNSLPQASNMTEQNLSTISHPEPTMEPVTGYEAAPINPSLPPKSDALSALQRGGDLERRASRRFSAYQIQKHLGGTPNGIPVIPPAQNSPIPNRGREVRESMSAVRSRTSATRQRSANRLAEIGSSSPTGFKGAERISEERDEQPVISRPGLIGTDTQGGFANGGDSPTVKTPEEFEGPPRTISGVSNGGPIFGATSGPLSPELPQFSAQRTQGLGVRLEALEKETAQVNTSSAEDPNVGQAKLSAINTTQPTFVDNLEPSPIVVKELTLFLQYKSKIKKFVLSDGYEDLTMARLQLAFIEKFNWNTHNNGVDLPEIYIQDPVSGVRHELEDMTDVKDRSVLVLNVEVLDEVKRHFDESIGGLKTTLEDVRTLLDGQGSMMERFGDRQLESAKEMARLSALPNPRSTRAPANVTTSSRSVTPSDTSMSEIQNLRRDIAVLRQTYSTMSSDFAATMKDIKAKAETVKNTARQAAIPTYEGDAGRAHVNAGKRTLSTESELLVNRVDDLTDAVEDLRKDVVTRGVRPLPRQLEELNREISSTAKDLTKIKEFIKREKPIWTKIWEQELSLVCTERDDLTQQEELMADLDGDLGDVTGVFKLVEEAMKQQNLQNGGQASLRSVSRQVEIDTSGVDPRAAKDGVLGEVRALQPNHESRLEAIERAERVRQKELESRKEGEFQREVANFVEEGKLRKTGGMEEVERLRKIKDERARKENFERAAARAAEQERKRAEEAAALAAAAAAEKEANQNATTEHTHIAQDTADLSSQEGEAMFQDASENVTAVIRPSESHDQLLSARTTIQSIDQSNRTNQNVGRSSFERLEQDLPPLPDNAKTTEEGGKKPDNDAPSEDDRSSWWKPAIFASS